MGNCSILRSTSILELLVSYGLISQFFFPYWINALEINQCMIKSFMKIFNHQKNEDVSIKTSAFEQHHWIIFYSIFHLYLKLCLPNLLEIIIYLNLLSTMTLFELWHFPNFIHCQHTDQILNKQDEREK